MLNFDIAVLGNIMMGYLNIDDVGSILKFDVDEQNYIDISDPDEPDAEPQPPVDPKEVSQNVTGKNEPAKAKTDDKVVAAPSIPASKPAAITPKPSTVTITDTPIEPPEQPEPSPPKTEYLTDHFKKSEFACGCKGKYCDGYGGIPTATLKKTAEFFEKFRELFQKTYPDKNCAIIIRSGVRCQKYNAKLPGSSSKSAHMQGTAGDISVKGLTQSQISATAKTYLKDTIKKGGIGFGGNHYTHLDWNRKTYQEWHYK
jgi:hypothetical protein